MNPDFVDVDANDFHLDPNSLCIDAGLPWSDYLNEPSPNGNRINLGAYGNTPEATTTIDVDGDGFSDAWQMYYWPDYDPCVPDPNYGPNGNPDLDDFNNLTEYLFGYNPNQVTTEPLDFVSDWDPNSTEITQIDPTKNETYIINYMINKNASVDVNFTNTDTSESVWTSETTTVGLHQVVWGGTDANGMFVERYFYDVSVDVNDGQYNWTSSDHGTTSYTSTNDYDVNSSGFNPYQNIPVKIACEMDDWYTRKIDVVQDGQQNEDICHIIQDRLIQPGWNSFDWYGYWNVEPNTGEMYKGDFDVYFDVAGNVNKGAVLVYYPELLTSLRCNPYRILPLADEVTTITYDLACDANVAIDTYDPDGNYFGTLTEEQQAGPQEVIWYGTTKDPNDLNSRYISTEGVYRIEVGIENMSEKLEGSITVYR